MDEFTQNRFLYISMEEDKEENGKKLKKIKSKSHICRLKNDKIH